MTQKPICDYADFDYKQVYWEQVDRRYENLCDQKTLASLLKKLPTKPQLVLDAGCGFGRLYDQYAAYGTTFFLLDYATNLLAQFRDALVRKGGLNKHVLIQGNFYQLPITSSKLDLAISVRTLHHMVDPFAFFKEINRILKLHGHFIIEIPNKRHLLNIARFLLKKTTENPFSHKPLVKKETFINYHPTHIVMLLREAGLIPIAVQNTSFLRSEKLKKKISPGLLSAVDTLFSACFSFLNMAPSIYILCEKRGIAQSG